MMMYNIEFIRYIVGRDEPEIIDIHNMMSPDLGGVIHNAGASLRTVKFRVEPTTFRIRENGGPIVYQPEATLVMK